MSAATYYLTGWLAFLVFICVNLILLILAVGLVIGAFQVARYLTRSRHSEDDR